MSTALTYHIAQKVIQIIWPTSMKFTKKLWYSIWIAELVAVDTDISVDTHLLLQSETCQDVQLTTDEHIMNFNIAAEVTEFLFEINYQVGNVQQHDCDHADEIRAYTTAKLTSRYSCGRRKTQYTNPCKRIATHALNGLQGCRIKCSADAEPFSTVHVIMRWPYSTLKLCGIHSCPKYWIWKN